MKNKTDSELKDLLASALDSALAPMHELERRGYTVELDPMTLTELDPEQEGGVRRTTIFNPRVYKTTTTTL